MIYTSYYAKINKLDRGKYIFISISNGNPIKDKVTNKLTELVPKWDIVEKIKSGEIDSTEYDKLYIDQLESIGFDEINELLINLIDPEKDLVLLCYEGKNKHCHRHVFAKWFNEKINRDYIKELE